MFGPKMMIISCIGVANATVATRILHEPAPCSTIFSVPGRPQQDHGRQLEKFEEKLRSDGGFKIVKYKKNGEREKFVTRIFVEAGKLRWTDKSWKFTRNKSFVKNCEKRSSKFIYLRNITRLSVEAKSQAIIIAGIEGKKTKKMIELKFGLYSDPNWFVSYLGYLVWRETGWKETAISYRQMGKFRKFKGDILGEGIRVVPPGFRDLGFGCAVAVDTERGELHIINRETIRRHTKFENAMKLKDIKAIEIIKAEDEENESLVIHHVDKSKNVGFKMSREWLEHEGRKGSFYSVDEFALFLEATLNQMGFETELMI